MDGTMGAGLADFVATAASAVPGVFARLFSRFHWVSVGAALLLAFAVWHRQRRQDPAAAGTGFLGWLFPRQVWLHRSALLDYRFVLVDKTALAVLIAIGALLFTPGAEPAIEAGGDVVEDALESAVANAAEASLAIVLLYTAALLLTTDFFRYWSHRLMHWSPLLWQFHKVHHSPEVLVPLSQMRTHPVNGLVNLARSGLAIGVVTGAFLLIFPGELSVVSILGVNAGRFLFDVMGAQLRHSHVWLAFPGWLSRVLISPAQHQIHHSSLERHLDRNFGSQFALWDWMFGTLYVPERRETLRFGIAGERPARLGTVRALYLQPFRDARRLVSRRRRRRPVSDRPRTA